MPPIVSSRRAVEIVSMWCLRMGAPGAGGCVITRRRRMHTTYRHEIPRNHNILRLRHVWIILRPWIEDAIGAASLFLLLFVGLWAGAVLQ